ncbi:MAG: AI-2E family transporter, partial [Bacteroidia bacterium]|nr:AI-2E family transporter [Bacteroidia bacterium]
MRFPLTRYNALNQDGKDQYLRVMQYILYGSIILYLGRDLFVPLSFAALISFILYPICIWLERKGIGRATAIFIGLLLLLLLTSIIALLLANQVSLFLREWPTLQLKVRQLVADLTQALVSSFSITEAQQNKWTLEFGGKVVDFIVQGVPTFLNASAYSAVLLIIIPVFTALILYSRNRLIEIVFQ